MNDKKETTGILESSKLKENPFSVPNGYFDSMQQEVMEKICPTFAHAAETDRPAEPATFMTYLKPALALVSVFAIVFGFGYAAMWITGVATDTNANIGEHVITESVEHAPYSTELTEDEIISIINRSIDNLYISRNNGMEIVADPIIDNEVIEQYLIDTRTSPTLIALLEQ